MKLLVASRNPKKLKELQRVLDARAISGIELVSLADVPEYPETPESGRTFADNALIKARDGAKATGLPCVADDSGIAVDELNGMPGVLSARWCGSHGPDEANTNLLLGQLGDVPDERRGAAFVSVCAIVTPEGEEHVATGEWRGRVLRAPRGENGFGYDPIFVPAEEDQRVAVSGGQARSAAELSAEEKDALSHRGRALAQLVPILRVLAAK